MTVTDFLKLPNYERKLIVFVDDDLYDQSKKLSENGKSEEINEKVKSIFNSTLSSIALKNLIFLQNGLIGVLLFPTIIETVKYFIKKIKAKDGIILTVPQSFSKKLILPPGHPSLNNIAYSVHPTLKNVYMPLSDFHRLTFENKCKELLDILTYLGAKKIIIKHIKGWDNELGAKIGLGAPDSQLSGEGRKISKESSKILYTAELKNELQPKLPTNLIWYQYESLWQAMANMRLDGGLSKFQVELEYVDDFGINADLNARVKKLNLNAGSDFKDYKSTIWHFEGEF